jgi:ABC-type sulfate transport system permease subunit
MSFCYANNIYGVTLNKYFISKMAFKGAKLYLSLLNLY